ncbi:MAG: transposase [Candidatus Scalindua rubra]|uniref:Transposase n=1 Tax=Candidatus Scalindua rubra TaxID=1872076 RepID=A0A1E3X2R4_9BACT|nr:MAG: transposase [Candidatus Scalindua rubra]
MKSIETKKVKAVNNKTLIVTVDISKRTNVGYCRCPDGTDTKPFKFNNNGQGFNYFWNRITQMKNTYSMEEVVFGFESTGPYGEPIIYFMKKRDVKLIQVNPMHTKRVKELQGNSPNKTDEKDPKVIADIIELGHALTVAIPEGPAAELRRLTQARERAMQRRTSLFNQLQDLEFIIFPEFSQVFKNVKTKSAMFILEHFPAPQDIAKFKPECLTIVLKKVSRGKVGEERVKKLCEAAKTTVGIREGQKSILFEIKETLATIETTERFIAEIEKEIGTHLKNIPYSKFLLSIKGIGEITIGGLVGEVGDFRNFNTIAEILKYAGFDLFEISSGIHKGQRHISKRGRSLMRKILFFVSLNVVRKGGIMHEQYQKHLEGGMLKKKALIAISRKMLGIMFALVRDHSNYIENYVEKEKLKKAA